MTPKQNLNTELKTLEKEAQKADSNEAYLELAKTEDIQSCDRQTDAPNRGKVRPGTDLGGLSEREDRLGPQWIMLYILETRCANHI